MRCEINLKCFRPHKLLHVQTLALLNHPVARSFGSHQHVQNCCTFYFHLKLAHHCLFSGLITRELSRNFGISLFSRSMSRLSGKEATNFGHLVGISTSLEEYHQNFSASGCNLLQGFELIYRIYYGVHDAQHKRIQ